MDLSHDLVHLSGVYVIVVIATDIVIIFVDLIKVTHHVAA